MTNSRISVGGVWVILLAVVNPAFAAPTTSAPKSSAQPAATSHSATAQPATPQTTTTTPPTATQPPAGNVVPQAQPGAELTPPLQSGAEPGTETPIATEVATPPPAPKPDHFRRWGGTISANVPHPIFLEAEHRFTPKWSAGLGAGGLSINNFNINGIPISASIKGLDVRGRWHPFNGAFFLGLALGYQQFSGAGTKTIPVTVNTSTVNVDTTVTANIAALYATPHLGWFWVTRSGFTLGFDVGVEVPLAPKTTTDITTNRSDLNQVIQLVQTTQDYKDLQTKVNDTGDKLGRIPLPYVTVLRLGWMF